MEKNKIWMILIIVLLVIMCAGLTFGFIVTFKQLQEFNVVKGTEAPSADSIDPKDLIIVSYADPITCNLLDSPDGSEHFVKLNLSIALNGKEKEAADLQTLLTEKDVLVKDIANRIIRNKTYEQIKAPDGQDELANEILDRVSQEFNSNVIISVLFKDIVHQ